MKFQNGRAVDARRAQEMDCGGFDPSDSDAVKGKGSSRVGKEERERERRATWSPMGGRRTRATDVAWMKSERACYAHSGLVQ